MEQNIDLRGEKDEQGAVYKRENMSLAKSVEAAPPPLAECVTLKGKRVDRESIENFWQGLPFDRFSKIDVYLKYCPSPTMIVP